MQKTKKEKQKKTFIEEKMLVDKSSSKVRGRSYESYRVKSTLVC